MLFLADSARSHGYGAHDHLAGCSLLSKSLNEGNVPIESRVYHYGWPEDASAFDGVDCVVMYGDGGRGHMVMRHLDEMDALAKKGVGIVCLHYAVEVPKGPAGDKFLRMDRRLFRNRLVGQSALDGQLFEPSRASDHARRQAVRDQRRMVLSHAVSRRDAGRDADPHAICRRANRCRAGRQPQRQSPRAGRGRARGTVSTWRGPSNATMAAAALASPAATCIGIGPIRISASSCSTRSPGARKSTCRPKASAITEDAGRHGIEPRRTAARQIRSGSDSQEVQSAAGRSFRRELSVRGLKPCCRRAGG